MHHTLSREYSRVLPVGHAPSKHSDPLESSPTLTVVLSPGFTEEETELWRLAISKGWGWNPLSGPNPQPSSCVLQTSSFTWVYLLKDFIPCFLWKPTSMVPSEYFPVLSGDATFIGPSVTWGQLFAQLNSFHSHGYFFLTVMLHPGAVTATLFHHHFTLFYVPIPS